VGSETLLHIPSKRFVRKGICVLNLEENSDMCLGVFLVLELHVYDLVLYSTQVLQIWLAEAISIATRRGWKFRRICRATEHLTGS
jgi:hypothetical protein